MATLSSKQKKQLYQLLKPWSVNFLAWLKSSGYGGGGEGSLDAWYKSYIYFTIPYWEKDFGPQTYPVTLSLVTRGILKRGNYRSKGGPVGEAAAYQSSGDAQADKDTIIAYQTGQLELLRQLRSTIAGILPLSLGTGSVVALEALDKIITKIAKSIDDYKAQPPPSL